MYTSTAASHTRDPCSHVHWHHTTGTHVHMYTCTAAAHVSDIRARSGDPRLFAKRSGPDPVTSLESPGVTVVAAGKPEIRSRCSEVATRRGQNGFGKERNYACGMRCLLARFRAANSKPEILVVADAPSSSLEELTSCWERRNFLSGAGS